MTGELNSKNLYIEISFGIKGDIGPQGPEGSIGPQGVQGIQGPKGDPLKYTDLTPAQKLELKGPKGDTFKFSDLTPENKTELKGDPGKPYPLNFGKTTTTSFDITENASTLENGHSFLYTRDTPGVVYFKNGYLIDGLDVEIIVEENEKLQITLIKDVNGDVACTYALYRKIV